MIVEFDREKVFQRYILSDVHRFVWKILIIVPTFVFLFISFKGTELDKYLIPGFIILMILSVLTTCWAIYVSYKVSKTRVYEFEEDKHTETYSVITKTRNQARTQVVNDIQIDQDLFDKFFDLYNLTVNYGFGGGDDGGYSFEYKFLSEQKALELEKKIKSSGTNINIK